MKRMLMVVLLSVASIVLVGCSNEQSIIATNLTDDYTITQYVGEDDIDLSGITVTDQNGMNLAPFLEISGPYNLNIVGHYIITLSVSDNFGTTLTKEVTLQIIEPTCDMDPNQDKCKIAVSGITFQDESLSLNNVYVDDFIKLKWDVFPSDATNSEITITSSDPSIATVSVYGYVFGKKPGIVTITISTVDGNYSLTKQITVSEKNCTVDPYQDKCINAFLYDTSRIAVVNDPNVSGTNYQTLYYNNKIYYEIFVRTFADSDGDNVGDFQGIIDNLSYLKELGVGGIWLMPINATSSDHGYDINDYYAVNPDYGTLSDFEELVNTASAMGIDIIMDLVINHMGAKNDIFQDVLRNGTNSDYYNWFTWIDSSSSRSSEKGSWGQQIWWNPTNRSWLRNGYYSVDSTIQNQSYFGYFSDWMPDLNLENPDVIQYIYNVADYWLTTVGVHGFRMDATSHFYALHEHPEVVDREQKNIDFLTAFYNYIVSVKSDAFVVTEAWEDYQTYTKFFASGVNSFDFQGSYWIKDAADGTLTDDIGSRLQLIYNSIATYRSDFIDPIFLSNHDMDRVAVVLDNPDEIRQAAELLLTVPGSPFIYYGDELGMRGTRTNMIWGSYYASMDTNSADYSVSSVSTQLADENSLLQHYKALSTVRNNSLALSYGSFIPYTSDKLEGYYRIFNNGTDQELVIVLFNFNSTISVPIPEEFTQYDILYHSFDNDFGGISPNGTMILRLPYSLLDSLT